MNIRILAAAMLCLSVYAGQAFAANEEKPLAVEATPENPVDQTTLSHREKGFVFTGGLDWGIGSAGSASGAVQTRTMNTMELTAKPGYQWWEHWAPRLLLSYGFTGQNTDTASVAGTNLMGSGYLIGLGTTYSWRNWDFLGGIEFLGSYTEGQSTATGDTSSFGSPFGVRLGGSYFFKKNWSADAFFHYVQYSSNTIGSNTVSLSSDRIRFWALALGISYQL